LLGKGNIFKRGEAPLLNSSLNFSANIHRRVKRRRNPETFKWAKHPIRIKREVWRDFVPPD
jgi:ribosomal protein L24E